MNERQFFQIANTLDRENVERIISRQVQYAHREKTSAARQYFLDNAMALFQSVKKQKENR